MDCPQCGSDNMQGAEKCWQCSTRLSPAPEPRSRNNMIVWAVMGAVAFGVVVMLFVATSGGGGGSGGASSIDSTASPVATAVPSAVSTPAPVPKK